MWKKPAMSKLLSIGPEGVSQVLSLVCRKLGTELSQKCRKHCREPVAKISPLLRADIVTGEFHPR